MQYTLRNCSWTTSTKTVYLYKKIIGQFNPCSRTFKDEKMLTFPFSLFLYNRSNNVTSSDTVVLVQVIAHNSNSHTYFTRKEVVYD